MKRYLAFIKEEYVRDAQAFTNGPIEDGHDPLEDEFGWRDAHGPMLVIDRRFDDVDALMRTLSALYPDADPRIFTWVAFEDKEE